jgi:hypothetical protein
MHTRQRTPSYTHPLTALLKKGPADRVMPRQAARLAHRYEHSQRLAHLCARP